MYSWISRTHSRQNNDTHRSEIAAAAINWYYYVQLSLSSSTTSMSFFFNLLGSGSLDLPSIIWLTGWRLIEPGLDCFCMVIQMLRLSLLHLIFVYWIFFLHLIFSHWIYFIVVWKISVRNKNACQKLNAFIIQSLILMQKKKKSVFRNSNSTQGVTDLLQ